MKSQKEGNQKGKVVRVGLNQSQHLILEAYQTAAQINGLGKTSKENLIILCLENGGLKWLKKETEKLKEKAISKID